MQALPSPATKSGCVTIASTSLVLALSLKLFVLRLAILDIALASPCTVVAKFGAEQPSIAKPKLEVSVIDSNASLTDFCTG